MLVVLLLLLRRTPRTLGGGPRESQHIYGVGREDPDRRKRNIEGTFSEATNVQASL